MNSLPEKTETSSKKRRQRERKEMRENILQAAIKLFLEEGYEKVTIRRIAEEIQYTPGSIYFYFEDKTTILYELHRHGFQKLYERFAAIQESDPMQRLYAIGWEYLQFGIECPEYYDLMFIQRVTAAVITEEKEWEEGLQTFSVLMDAVRACMNAGLLPEGDVHAVSFALWANVHGMLSLVIRDRLIPVNCSKSDDLLKASYEYMMKMVVMR